MRTTLAAAIALGAPFAFARDATIDWTTGAFQLRVSGRQYDVPVREAARVPMAVSVNRRWAVWDERGLTSRDGEWTHSTRLEEVAVTPKLFSKSEIEANVAAFAKGERKRGATRLTGYALIGTIVYAEGQWVDQSGAVWLEALVKVDLNQERPKASLVGRLPGRTFDAPEPIASVQGRLGVVKVVEGAWGIALWSPTESPDEAGVESEFRPLGRGLTHFAWGAPGRTLVFVEKTAYGTYLAGRADVTTFFRRNLTESRSVTSVISGEPAVVRLERERGFVLRSLETGAEMAVAADAGLRSTPHGVLVWTPSTTPEQAALYEVARWRGLASWVKPKPRPPAPTGSSTRPGQPSPQPSRPRR